MASTATTSWWQHQPALARVVQDLLAAELAQARPGRSLPPMPWGDGLDLVADLGADSLDLMAAASALGDFLGMTPEHGADLLATRTLGGWIAAARAGLSAGGGRLTFRTSGSTGAPKRCGHEVAALWREAEELARLLPGRRRVLAAVPSHHIYGFLFTVLLPQCAHGLPVHDLRRTSPAAVPGQLRAGDLVVGHPDFWDRIASVEPRFAPDVAGVSSTAPLPEPAARTLAAGGLRLLEVYGSSETAGVGWRDAAGAPYRLFPYWRRGGEEGAIERRIGGDRGGESLRYPLQDRLRWVGPDSFLPEGRIDDAVQVGGTNVFPSYVAGVLALHPQVAACAVRIMRPDEGRRLKAFVVPRPGSDPAALRADLAAWVGQRLAPPECPAAYSFGPGLPRQPNGKAADWIIDAWE